MDNDNDVAVVVAHCFSYWAAKCDDIVVELRGGNGGLGFGV